jgi:hypothetical protein
MWNDNAEMIADAFALFIDLKKDRVLDPTYGAGNFYKIARPKRLVTHDIRIDGFDARSMTMPVIDSLGFDTDKRKRPYQFGSFQAVVLDFPYVSQGGRDTSTIEGMQEQYGMYDAPRTPEAVQDMIDDGVHSARLLLKTGGYLFVKTMNYVSSGKIFDSVFQTKDHAKLLGMALVGEFVFCNGLPGPQPRTNLDGSPRTQVHGRNNFSTLLVFRKD